MAELERRDTPAWWAVTPPTLAEGTAGSTAATHAGQIGVSPAYAPDDNGVVTAHAATATEAAAQGLFGTITVTVGGQSHEYTYGPDTVGTSAAEQKPFLVTLTGGVVTVGFEDMAGLPGCDYDYNDRTWAGASSGSASSPVVWEQTNVWTGPYGDATVTLKVTEEDPATFRWNYRLHNDSYTHPVVGGDPYGLAYLTLPIADASVVRQAGSSVGSYGGTDSGLMGGDHLWWMFGTEWDPGLLPGEHGDFWYTTPPMLINQVAGVGWWVEVTEYPTVVGATVTAAHWREMDDVPPPDTVYVSFQPEREWLNIDVLLNRLREDPTAKELIAKAAADGVQVYPRNDLLSGGLYNPQTLRIYVDIRITSTDDAASVLLFELLRHKHKHDQLKLDNRVKNKNDSITPDEYATECEKLSYKYIDEHHKISAAAYKGGNGPWSLRMDLYRVVLAAETGKYRSFELYLEEMKKKPPMMENARSHYGEFLVVYDQLRGSN